MGCIPGNDYNNTNCCYRYQPGTNDGVALEYTEYPINVIRSGGSYNIPGREGSVVMYPSIELCQSTGSPTNNQAANCGKLTRVNPRPVSGGQQCIFIYDYYPNGLSFDHMYSDSWFSYLYDTSDNAGVIGKPCYWVEDEYVNGTGGTDENGDPLSDTQVSGSLCYPCTSFSCTPASTTLTYTVEGDDDLTGDPDAPHPTLFGVGTNSNKLVFKYDSLSSTLPNGVLDFSVTYNAGTYVDAWNENAVEGIPYDSSQNTWVAGDEAIQDFQVFDLEDTGNNKTGLRVKFNIKPKYDDSGSSTTFQGTTWEPTEILNPGTGYAVNDTFNLSYVVTHTNSSQTTLTLTVKITSVGPVQTTQGQSGFDVLRSGDTINGHTITRVFHTDLDNFPYHIAYLNGSGSNFAKDTQYTSNRSHQITAKVGKGIPDRAILVGKYEFLNKSLQYCTTDVDKNAPDIFNVLNQPKITPTLTNGVLTGVTIVDGGSGWLASNLQGRDPDLIVSYPVIATGKQATLKSEFTNGVLTACKVSFGGSGYTADNPPTFLIENYEKRETIKIKNDVDNAKFKGDVQTITKAINDQDVITVTQNEISELEGNIDKIPEETVIHDLDETYKVKMDPNRNRVRTNAQQLFTKQATDPYKEGTKQDYDLKYLDDVDVPREYKTMWNEEKERDQVQRAKDVDDITQERAITYDVRPESLVETVQGPTSDLPYASTYTKYMMRQYRPDPKRRTTINVKLTCTPVNEGCGHVTCGQPGGRTGGTTTGENGETITTTYNMTGVLGSGCKTWTAEGGINMFNDMTAAAQQVADATASYGNPYQIT